MNLQVEPPEKKRRRKKTPKNSSRPPSFSLLPDEIVANCLARVSRLYYPSLSVVSRSFRSLVSSTDLYAARSHLETTEQFLYVCLSDNSYQFSKWFTLWINPNRTLTRMKKKKTPEHLLVPIKSSEFPSVSKSTVVIGSEIYVFGGPVDGEGSSAVRILDCRSHARRDAPSMNVSRKNPLACVYDGEIYVFGGCAGAEDESWGEVYDTKTQAWRRLSDPGTEIRSISIYSILEIQGKIHFWSSNKTYAYDPEQDRWESCKGSIAFPRSQCVMESVWFRYGVGTGYYDYECHWSTGGYWKEVRGLESLGEKYKRNGGSSCNTTKLVSCGGKLLLLWEGYMKHNPSNRKKIWCAEIAIEKREGGEVWGNVEWVDVVRSVPISCQLLHCLVVSV